MGGRLWSNDGTSGGTFVPRVCKEQLHFLDIPKICKVSLYSGTLVNFEANSSKTCPIEHYTSPISQMPGKYFCCVTHAYRVSPSDKDADIYGLLVVCPQFIAYPCRVHELLPRKTRHWLDSLRRSEEIGDPSSICLGYRAGPPSSLVKVSDTREIYYHAPCRRDSFTS